MPFDPDRYHRQSIWLPGYDYAQAGGYFVTICVHGRAPVLGTIEECDFLPNDVGLTVENMGKQLPGRFPGLLLDAYVVMPNHVHGVLFLGSDPTLAVDSKPRSLGSVMRVFKSVSAIAANRMLERVGAPFWQRNYYEHIVRSDRELERIRHDIADNPTRWALDPDNPINANVGPS